MDDAPAKPQRTLAYQSIVLLLVLCSLVWYDWPDGRLRVAFLATKGDAMLIQTPRGNHVLIDGGNDPATLTAAIGRQMPFWRRHLKLVVLTTPSNRQIASQAAVFARYRPDAVLTDQPTQRSAALDEWQRLLEEHRTPIAVARVGARIDLDGATLRILALGDGEAHGLVMRLDYGATSIFFNHTGNERNEAALLAQGARRVNVMVFPWERDPHTALVEQLRPRAFVLTDGWASERPALLTTTQRAVGGAAIYHEDLHGTITWISDGQRNWIETERP